MKSPETIENSLNNQAFSSFDAGETAVEVEAQSDSVRLNNIQCANILEVNRTYFYRIKQKLIAWRAPGFYPYDPRPTINQRQFETLRRYFDAVSYGLRKDDLIDATFCETTEREMQIENLKAVLEPLVSTEKELTNLLHSILLISKI